MWFVNVYQSRTGVLTLPAKINAEARGGDIPTHRPTCQGAPGLKWSLLWPGVVGVRPGQHSALASIRRLPAFGASSLTNISDTIYSFIGFGKTTPPQNVNLFLYCVHTLCAIQTQPDERPGLACVHRDVSHLTGFIYLLPLESQLPNKIVNLLFTITYQNLKLLVWWQS